MVNNVDRSGLRDWLVQRVSAVIIGLYAIYLLVYLFVYQPLYFAQWQSLFNSLWMKIATIIVLLSVLWHAWIGLWTIFTDYVKPKAVRLLLETLVILLLLAYLVWAIEILWGL